MISTELCVRDIRSCKREKLRQDIKAVRNNCKPTCNYQCWKQQLYIHLYLPLRSIPKIKAQLTTTYDQSSRSCLLSTIYSPLVHHGQYRAVCARHQILHGQKKARHQGVIANPLVTTNAESNSYIHLYLPSRFIPKIKAQLTTTYGRHTASILFVRLTTLTQSELPMLTPTCV